MSTFRKKRLIIAGIILIGILLTSLAAFTYLYQSSKKQIVIDSNDGTQTNTVDQQRAIRDKVTAVNDEAIRTLAQTDNAAANGVYDSAIAAASSQEERVQLYVKKASNALNTGQSDLALASAKEAENISPIDFEVVYTLAVIYEQRNDTGRAALYYRKVAAVAPESNEQTPSSYGKQFYVEKAVALEGGE